MKQAMIDCFKYSEFFCCIKNILENIKDVLTRCPDCKGKGGYTDVILDDGTGPYYPCGFCDGGYMNVYKKVYWKIVLSYANRQSKRNV